MNLFIGIVRWWHQGDGDRAHVLDEEARLRQAIEESAEASRHAKIAAEIHTSSTNGLIKTLEKSIEAIKRGQKEDDHS